MSKAVLVSVAWLGAVSSAWGQVTLDESAGFSIRSHDAAGGRCLDVPQGDVRAGVRLIVWDCHGGENQRFFTESSGRFFGMRGLCVDAFGGQGLRGDPIGLWPCHGNPNQRWDLVEAAGSRYFRIRGVNGRCIEVARADRQNGAPLVLADCSDDPRQQFTFR